MAQRGTNRGSRNGNSDLSESEVYTIRERWDQGVESARAIGTLFGLGAETIRRIGRRESWAWLPEQGTAPKGAEISQAAAESEARLKALLTEGDPMKDLKEEMK